MRPAKEWADEIRAEYSTRLSLEEIDRRIEFIQEDAVASMKKRLTEQGFHYLVVCERYESTRRDLEDAYALIAKQAAELDELSKA